MKHFRPILDVFAGSNAVVDDFLVTIRLDANGNIDSFTIQRLCDAKECR